MITSRLTSKGKTTIPQPVRAALNLRDGDKLQCGLQGDHVVLTKVERPPEPFAVFDEWHSETDRQAYAKL